MMDFRKIIKKQLPAPSLRLAAGLLMVLALASCDWLGISNPFADDQRVKQVVEGPRHAPILNPDTVPPEPVIRGYVHGVEPPQTQPVREGINPEYYSKGNAPIAASGENTPNAGIPLVSGVNTPDTGAPANSGGSVVSSEGFGTGLSSDTPGGGESDEKSAEEYYNSIPATPDNQPGFFSRLFGSGKGSSSDTARKRLPGNPYDADNDVTPSAAPEADTPPVTPTVSPSDNEGTAAPWQRRNGLSGGVSSASPASAEPPTVDVAQNSDPAQNNVDVSASQPSWFGRMFGKYSGNEQDPARGAPTPDLSSVPPPPPQFQAVKDGKAQELQELQGDHIAAEQEKQQLDSEPSQLPPAPPATAAPAGGSGAQSANPPAGSTGPVLLGHASASDSNASYNPSALQLPASYDLPPPAAANKPAGQPQPDDYVSALQRARQAAQSAATPQVVPAAAPVVSTALPPPDGSGNQATGSNTGTYWDSVNQAAQEQQAAQ